jgi:hypothetical protein
MMEETLLPSSLSSTIPYDEYPVEIDRYSIEDGRVGSVKRARVDCNDDDDDDSCIVITTNKIAKLEENADDSSSHVLLSTSSSAPLPEGSSPSIGGDDDCDAEEDDEEDEETDYEQLLAENDAEVLASKFPFTLVNIPSTDPEVRDIREVQFHMDVDQIELLERDHFDDANEEKKKEYGPRFNFIHFPGQFWLVNAPKNTDDDDGDESDVDSEEEEERKRRPSSTADIARFIEDAELRAKWIRLAKDHEYEKMNRLAKSPHPKENAWFQENAIYEHRMVADSSECKVKSLLFNPTWDAALQYRITFSDAAATTTAPFKGITEHMAICALEQILRERAPYNLKQAVSGFMYSLRKNCTDMASRYAYIYHGNDAGESNNDVLIGDLMTIEENDQEDTQIVRKLNCISCDDGEYEVTLNGIVV